MSEVVWRFPSPSSGFHHGVIVQLKPRREIVLTFEFQDANGEMRSGELAFSAVAHYRTTYLPALRAEMISEAYDQVKDVGTSPELLEVMAALQANGHSDEVRHYRVCFDDGPCFDFIAAAFEGRVT